MNSTVPLTFSPGSADGTEVCTPLTAFADLLVESEEEFSVSLALVTPGSSLRLGNTTATAITLTDGDGMCSSGRKYIIKLELKLVIAMKIEFCSYSRFICKLYEAT